MQFNDQEEEGVDNHTWGYIAKSILSPSKRHFSNLMKQLNNRRLLEEMIQQNKGKKKRMTVNIKHENHERTSSRQSKYINQI